MTTNANETLQTAPTAESLNAAYGDRICEYAKAWFARVERGAVAEGTAGSVMESFMQVADEGAVRLPISEIRNFREFPDVERARPYSASKLRFSAEIWNGHIAAGYTGSEHLARAEEAVMHEACWLAEQIFYAYQNVVSGGKRGKAFKGFQDLLEASGFGAQRIDEALRMSVAMQKDSLVEGVKHAAEVQTTPKVTRPENMLPLEYIQEETRNIMVRRITNPFESSRLEFFTKVEDGEIVVTPVIILNPDNITRDAEARLRLHAYFAQRMLRDGLVREALDPYGFAHIAADAVVGVHQPVGIFWSTVVEQARNACIPIDETCRAALGDEERNRLLVGAILADPQDEAMPQDYDTNLIPGRGSFAALHGLFAIPFGVHLVEAAYLRSLMDKLEPGLFTPNEIYEYLRTVHLKSFPEGVEDS